MSRLTIEEFLTMGWNLNPARVTYREKYNRLQQIHDFTFSESDNFTPRQKTAITRLYKKYQREILRLQTENKNKRFTFIKATKAQRDKFKSQYVVTNKGIIYNRPVSKAKIVGKGKDTRILAETKLDKKESVQKRNHKIELYIQFPEEIKSDPDLINEFVKQIQKQFKPDYISVAINHYAGTAMYSPKTMNHYAPDLTDKLSNIPEQKNPFTGVYIIYYRQRVNKKWLTNLNQKIELLF